MFHGFCGWLKVLWHTAVLLMGSCPLPRPPTPNPHPGKKVYILESGMGSEVFILILLTSVEVHKAEEKSVEISKATLHNENYIHFWHIILYNFSSFNSSTHLINSVFEICTYLGSVPFISAHTATTLGLSSTSFTITTTIVPLFLLFSKEQLK